VFQTFKIYFKVKNSR